MNRSSASLISIFLTLTISLSSNMVFAAGQLPSQDQFETKQSEPVDQPTQSENNPTNQLGPANSEDGNIDATDPIAVTSDGPFTTAKFSQQDEIAIKHPTLKALVSFESELNPYSLDAENTRSVGLRDVLLSVTDRNLDIGIAKLSEGIGKYNYWGSLGKFLPDILLGYNYQYLRGTANIPFGSSGPIRMNNPLIIAEAGFRYYGYRGGATLFGALQSRNLYRAAVHAKKATISNALLDATKRYYDLVLNEAILQIRIRAVEVSQAQLNLSQNLWDTGSANRLDVFQAETQLSQDRQNLIDQQIARRKSAIELAELLNLDQSFDLVPGEPILRKRRLIGEHIRSTELLRLAIGNRPELQEVEQQRLAAKKAVVVASAPLQPTFAFTGSAYGIGQTLSNSSQTTITPITLATAQGPVTAYSTSRSSRQISNLNALGFAVNWNLDGLGTIALANIQSAHLGARQAQLRSIEELNMVLRQVRESYLNSLSAQQKIHETANQVRSATEEIRLARLRFENGLGKNIDVLRAQQDYTSSLIEKARAIANFNTAQTQLLHDIGLISVDALTQTEGVAAIPENRG